MRYKTFRNLFIIGAITLFLGSCFGFYRFIKSGRSGQSSSVQISQPNNKSSSQINSSTSDSSSNVSHSVDEKILNFLKNSATSDKVKDAFPREKFKVSFYRERPGPSWTRLKIDLNRNEKWDEKWDLENGQPAKRHVSSRDDEHYDQEFRWLAGHWEMK